MKNFGFAHMNFRRNNMIIINIFVYVALYFFFYLSAGNRLPPEWLFRQTIVLSIFFIAGYYFCSFFSGMSIWITVFLYHLTGSLLLEEMILYNTNDIFGLYSGDGSFYRDFVIETINWNWNDVVAFHELPIDDYGFPILLRGLAYLSWDPEQYFFLLILGNSFCVTVSSFILYQTGRKLLEKQYAKIAAILWGLSTYALFSTVHWLKENFFGLILILAFYGLLETCGKLNLQRVIAFMTVAYLTIFFRLVIPFIFLASFCGRFISIHFIKKYFLFLVITGFLFLFVLLDPFLRILGVTGGLEWILHVSEGRIQHTSASFPFMFLIQCLSSLFGPFPNFIGQSIEPYFLYNFYLLLKSLLSIYFLYGLYSLYRTTSI